MLLSRWNIRITVRKTSITAELLPYLLPFIRDSVRIEGFWKTIEYK